MASTPPSPLGREARRLSARESEIVRLVVPGCRNKEVAVRLSVEEQTVKNHLRKIFSKLGIARRCELPASHWQAIAIADCAPAQPSALR